MISAAADGRARKLWARWVGFLLVLTNGTAMFAFSTRASFVTRNDPQQTAASIAGSETWFRLGLAFDLLTIVGVIPLVAGLYIVLKPVGSNLALLAMLWRVVENSVLAALAFASFMALTLVAGGDFIRALAPGQAQDLVYGFIRVHSWGFQVGFLFLGFGQLAFSWLWWKSRYIPRPLAALGMLGSSILATVAIGIIIWPPLYGVLTMAYMAPMGLYEIGLGLWLLIRGIRIGEQGSAS